MRTSRVADIDSHALGTLKYIRASIEAASSLAVPGAAGIAMGVVGTIAAAAAAMPELRDDWLSIWLLAGVVAAWLGATLMARQAFAQGLALFGAPVRKFIVCLLPAMFAGAVLTWVMWTQDELQLVPGTWLLLYGCALISASAVTLRLIGLFGAGFILFGVLAFQAPQPIQNLLLGAGFGGLHLVSGFMVGRMNRGR